MRREANLAAGKMVNLIWDILALKGLRNIYVLLCICHVSKVSGYESDALTLEMKL